MKCPGNYIAVNKALWNQRTAHHTDSAFYNMADFIKGENSLNSIELDLLENVAGKKILHLQCHFGQDSLSLARMGAEVTGIDFSKSAIEKANELSSQMQLPATFICCDLYDLPSHLSQQFDIVFTSYGTIGWLPNLEKWADIIHHFLLPGGRFVFAEFHPLVWMFDNDFTKITYSYFSADAIIEKEEGTYADSSAAINAESITWNHSLGEVIESLLASGLTLKHFQEYNYSPYACFKHSEKIAEKKFIIKPFEDKLPLVFAMAATK